MTHPTDHGRDELATALQQARAALGSAADVARWRKGLEAKLAQAGEAPLTAAEPVAGALWPKLVLVAALGGGALLYGLRPTAQPEAVAARVRLPDAPQASSIASAEAASASAASAPLGAAVSAPVANVPSSEAGRVRALATAARAPAVSRARSDGPASKASPAVGRNALVAAEPARVKPATPEAPIRGTQNPSRSDPEQEIALISRAQSELRVRPAAALLALDEHAARFAHGVLAQERDALRIDAERALGRDAQARKHAQHFIALYPSSPQARPLSRWLAEASAAEHKTSTPGRHTP